MWSVPKDGLSGSSLPCALNITFSSDMLYKSELIKSLLSLTITSVFEVSSVCSVSIDAFCFPPHAVTDKTANDAIAIIVNVLIFIVSWF